MAQVVVTSPSHTEGRRNFFMTRLAGTSHRQYVMKKHESAVCEGFGKGVRRVTRSRKGCTAE